MPAKSRRQQRYLEAKFGHEWVKAHHMDKVKGKTKKRAAKKKRK